MKHGTKPKFKYKRVKIIWQDIVTDPSWYDSLEDVDKLTIGTITVFPRSVVKKIEVLK